MHTGYPLAIPLHHSFTILEGNYYTALPFHRQLGASEYVVEETTTNKRSVIKHHPSRIRFLSYELEERIYSYLVFSLLGKLTVHTDDKRWTDENSVQVSATLRRVKLSKYNLAWFTLEPAIHRTNDKEVSEAEHIIGALLMRSEYGQILS